MPKSTRAVSPSLTDAQQREQDIALVLQAAVAQHKVGEYGDAQALYEVILNAAPQQADARFGLAMLMVQTGKPAEALPHFEAALDANPDHADCWVHYLNALDQLGHSSAAWIAAGIAQKRGIDSEAFVQQLAKLAPPVQFTAAPAPKPRARRAPRKTAAPAADVIETVAAVADDAAAPAAKPRARRTVRKAAPVALEA